MKTMREILAHVAILSALFISSTVQARLLPINCSSRDTHGDITIAAQQLERNESHESETFDGFNTPVDTEIRQPRHHELLLARFVTPDPELTSTQDGSNFNRYNYAKNNPYRYTDPDGRAPSDDPAAGGGGRYGVPVMTEATMGGGATFSPPPMMTNAEARAALSAIRAEAGLSPATAPVNKEVGSYTNLHLSGRTYSGKGGQQRSQVSGARVEAETGDPHIATDWKPSESQRESFKDESKRIDADGGVKSEKNYNKSESPGKKYRQQDEKK